MKMQEIREIAKSQGLKTGKLTKVALVRAVQESENNTPCFATDQVKSCGQDQCLWREDCIKMVKQKKN